VTKDLRQYLPSVPLSLYRQGFRAQVHFSLFLFLFLLSFQPVDAIGKRENTDTLAQTKSYRDYSFFLNDSYVIGGMSYSGIYYSNSFRNLSYRPGFQIGIEQYIPMKRIMFLSAGVHFTQRNFRHHADPDVIFRNNYIDLPFYACFELPVLKEMDLRFLLGAQIGIRLSSSQRNTYSEVYLADPANFFYRTSDFHRFDGGWSFGLSMERNNFIFKVRSYVGFAKMQNTDQGMVHSVNVDVGYFVFRQFKSPRK
jgi:hypothetical protein